jgi:DAACS family dicarboxylate/amino acid:cation (Na+ or H+) symporter
MVTAFSAASSNATLPSALRVAEENLRLPEQVSRFVLTVGATANQNGTALFEGVTVLFLPSSTAPPSPSPTRAWC